MSKRNEYMFFIVQTGSDQWKKVFAKTEEEALSTCKGEIIGKIPASEFLKREKAYENYFNQLVRKRNGNKAS
jgi:hypothetical protein